MYCGSHNKQKQKQCHVHLNATNCSNCVLVRTIFQTPEKSEVGWKWMHVRAGYLPTLANWASMCSAPITPQLKIPLLRLPITPNYLQIHFFQLHPWLICSRLTVSVSKVKRKKNQIPMHRQNYSPETSQLQSSGGHKLTLRTAL